MHYTPPSYSMKIHECMNNAYFVYKIALNCVIMQHIIKLLILVKLFRNLVEPNQEEMVEVV